jgi:methylated-DNA-protein-cysteine methyltransferase-like protein
MMSRFFDQVYRVVRRIPRGKVATYGQIAALLGQPRAARTVGWALHALPEGSDVPWHRVINARGRISTSCWEHEASLQQRRLEAEGIVFGPDGRVDLKVYRWEGLTWPEMNELRRNTGHKDDS